MQTTTFDIEKAEAVEKAVCEVFQCNIYDIVCLRDTFFKKVVVYLLVNIYGVNKRNIGIKYKIAYLYVPTVVLEMAHMKKVVPGFAEKINKVYGSINCEKETHCA